MHSLSEPGRHCVERGGAAGPEVGGLPQSNIARRRLLTSDRQLRSRGDMLYGGHVS